MSVPASFSADFGPSTAFGLAQASLVSNLAGGTKSLSLVLSDVLSCSAVGALIDPLFTGLCGAITASVGIARILIAAGVLLFVQLAIGVELCCHHPGDDGAWQDEAPKQIASSAPPAHGGGAPKSIAVSMV